MRIYVDLDDYCTRNIPVDGIGVVLCVRYYLILENISREIRQIERCLAVCVRRAVQYDRIEG